MAKAKVVKETEKARRNRHLILYHEAWVDSPVDVVVNALEIAVRAATLSAIPGKQKRGAAYTLKIREDAVKAAVKALRRAK